MAFKKKTIKIKKYSDVIEECVAAGTVTPGMLLVFDGATSDGIEKVKAHTTDGGSGITAFALEDELQGKEIDDDYSTNDKVQVWIAGRGDIVNAILDASEDVAVGDAVTSAGNGKVREVSTANDEVIGYAVTAVDTSTTVNDTRIQIRIK